MRGSLDLRRHRCAILRSFTVEPIVPTLEACAWTSGIDLAVHTGEFNAYSQEILDAASMLYAFEPDTAILAVETRDIAPELGRATAPKEIAERVSNQLAGLVRAFRAHTQANLIVHSLAMPGAAAQGVYDSQLVENQVWAGETINGNLRRLANEYRGVYVLDYDGLVARYGRERWGDERKWLTVRLPIAAANLVAMAREWMRYLAPLAGRIAKAVAVDLDNTLWGGVIGEEGLAGIQVGPEYPGAAYPRTATGARRSHRARHSAGGSQQKQSAGCHGGSRKTSRHAAAPRTFRRHAHQLEREIAKPEGTGGGVEYRARCDRVFGR
jgi:predicted enzyme involved in methoxymalonyl-ACP biosynthesis